MLGKLVDLPTIACAAVALGVLEQGIVWNNPRNPELVDPILAGVIIVCLLVRKIGSTPRSRPTPRRRGRRPTRCARCPASCARCPRCGSCAGAAAVLVLGALLALPLAALGQLRQPGRRPARS